jgi:excisionase family DNA binding protein
MSPNPYRPVQPAKRPRETWLSVPEVADELRISRMTIYRRIREGVLPATRIGYSLRVRERDLDAYLRDGDTSGWVNEE